MKARPSTIVHARVSRAQRALMIGLAMALSGAMKHAGRRKKARVA